MLGNNKEIKLLLKVYYSVSYKRTYIQMDAPRMTINEDAIFCAVPLKITSTNKFPSKKVKNN